MARRSDQTRYYLNPKLGRVALIRSGLRFPRGNWLAVADESVSPGRVEELVLEMFPNLVRISLDTLLTEFDVEEFERGLPEAEL